MQVEPSEDIVRRCETIADLLHLADGEVTLQLHFTNGSLRRADLHRGPVRPAELRELAERLTDEVRQRKPEG